MKILYLLILLVLGGGLGVFIYQDPGYAIFTYQNWLVELPLWLLIIGLVVFILVLHLALHLLAKVLSSGTRYQQWLKQRQENKARKKRIQGLIELTEGHWQKAEKLLIESLHPETSLLNYLFAARAAQEQGEHQRRDEYLRLALTVNPKADIAVSLTQAQLQIDHQQFEQALASLKHLKKISPKHKTVLKLLKNLYIDLKDWKNLLKLIPTLSKQKVINPQESHDLQVKCYLTLLEHTDKAKDPINQLFETWRKIPDTIAQEQEILLFYCQQLIKHGEHTETEIRLRESLKLKWNDKLVYHYGLVTGPSPVKQLTTAESWLKAHPNNPTLLLTVGRLAMRSQLWGKARDYLEASLSFLPSAKTYRELGLLLERLGEKDKSYQYFREGLRQVTRELPEITM